MNAFNQDILALVQGEEPVGDDGTRLFTRVRREFSTWSTVIEKNFQKGECQAPAPTWRVGRKSGMGRRVMQSVRMRVRS